MAQETQVLIPKASLPDCAVGETLEIVGEDKDNFIVSPQYNEEQPAAGDAGEGEMPAAVKAVMGK